MSYALVLLREFKLNDSAQAPNDMDRETYSIRTYETDMTLV
jgi:hypothetical protein